MSLTSHLKTPTSPIRLFLRDSFPILDGTKRGSPSWKQLSLLLSLDNLPSCKLPSPAPKSYQGTIGIAVDYRLRYYFKLYRSSDTVAAVGVDLLGGRGKKLGTRFLRHHDKLVARLAPLNRPLSEGEEAELNANCVVLAWFEQIFRCGRSLPAFEDSFRTGKVEDILAIVPPEAVKDIGQISTAFADDAKRLFENHVILNPTFSGSQDVGGADADIIVGKTLIDFKCTANINASKIRDAALQLLGYVLLDYGGKYDISEIMVYLPRHRTSWRVSLWQFVLPLADVVRTMTRGDVNPVDSLVADRLIRLRHEFQSVASRRSRRVPDLAAKSTAQPNMPVS